jgi:hypothetical protein
MGLPASVKWMCYVISRGNRRSRCVKEPAQRDLPVLALRAREPSSLVGSQCFLQIRVGLVRERLAVE